MTVDTNTLAKQIYEQARQLPPESLTDLAKYVEFLNYRTGGDKAVEQPIDVTQIVKLEGILEGYGIDVSPERLAEVRREMWRKFEDLET